MSVFEKARFKIEACMPETGVIWSYLGYANLVATNGTPVYHLGSAIPILLNELNLRGFYLATMKDQKNPRPFTVLSLLLGASADGKSTSAMTAVKHLVGCIEAQDVNNEQQYARALEFNGTPEGLRYKLATDFYNTTQEATIALIYQEEFTAIFQQAYGAVGEFLMRIYDGRDIEEQQRQHQRAQDSGATTHAAIRVPKINGLFCSTPTLLAKTITSAIASGGLYGRLLIFAGEDRAQPYEGDISGNDDYLAVQTQWEKHNEADVADWVKFLVDTFEAEGGAIRIAPEAHEVFRHRHTMNQDLVRRGVLDDNLRAMLGRASRTSWMIAALYATTQYRTVINADDARRACKLVDHCFNMGEGLASLFEQSETARRHQAIVQAVSNAKSQGLSKTDIHQAPGIKNKGVRKVEMQELLDTLEEQGAVVRIKSQAESRGRPAVRFYIPKFAPIPKESQN